MRVLSAAFPRRSWLEKASTYRTTRLPNPSSLGEAAGKSESPSLLTAAHSNMYTAPVLSHATSIAWRLDKRAEHSVRSISNAPKSLRLSTALNSTLELDGRAIIYRPVSSKQRSVQLPLIALVFGKPVGAARSSSKSCSPAIQ